MNKAEIKQVVLNEVSYRKFIKEVSKVSGTTKKKRSLIHLKKSLKEIEDIYSHITRLNESDGLEEAYWEKNREFLNEVSNKMIEMGLKIRKIGKK